MGDGARHDPDGHERVLLRPLQRCLLLLGDGRQAHSGPAPGTAEERYRLSVLNCSYFEKAERMPELAQRIALLFENAEAMTDSPPLALDPHAAIRAARLAKCDLTTDLVKEFTELQGVVEGLQARREDLGEEIATAIYDHYRPQSMEDGLPRAPSGDIVSLADRLDTLAGCFGVGLAPSGSKDPFGPEVRGSGRHPHTGGEEDSGCLWTVWSSPPAPFMKRKSKEGGWRPGSLDWRSSR